MRSIIECVDEAWDRIDDSSRDDTDCFAVAFMAAYDYLGEDALTVSATGLMEIVKVVFDSLIKDN